MSLRKFLPLAILALLFSLGLQAQTTATPKVSERQVKQTQRIKHGVKSGELTRAETATLAKQQKQIRRNKRQAKADGQVTNAERARLHAQQNQASRNVARKKNNGRKPN